MSRADEDSPVTLGNLVDEEMAATSQAIEAAALRIQEMLQKSREDDSGVKLEVNERILDSCTELMKAIRTLIQRAKDLQSEIVKEGMVRLLSLLSKTALAVLSFLLCDRENCLTQMNFTRRILAGVKD